MPSTARPAHRGAYRPARDVRAAIRRQPVGRHAADRDARQLARDLERNDWSLLEMLAETGSPEAAR